LPSRYCFALSHTVTSSASYADHGEHNTRYHTIHDRSLSLTAIPLYDPRDFPPRDSAARNPAYSFEQLRAPRPMSQRAISLRLRDQTVQDQRPQQQIDSSAVRVTQPTTGTNRSMPASVPLLRRIALRCWLVILLSGTVIATYSGKQSRAEQQQRKPSIFNFPYHILPHAPGTLAIA
jgi:hypothetical protein